MAYDLVNKKKGKVIRSMLEKTPRFRARRMTDGEYVEGCLIMHEGSPFTYILTDDGFNYYMTTDDLTGDCKCKLVRVLGHSVEQIR